MSSIMDQFDDLVPGDAETLMIIGAEKGYLINSIREILLKANFNIVSCSDISQIEKNTARISAILMNADEFLLGEQKLIVYVKDKATEEDIPLFTVGNYDFLDSLKKLIPSQLIQKEFCRPINVKDLVSDISTYLEEHDKKKQKKILAVDDSGVVLHSIKTWLGDKYQVMLADSGLSAIKYMTLNRPDLILLDYEMPIIDGSQVLEMIHSEGEFADIPVIFLTGKQDRESIMKVMNLKPAGYLLKTMKPLEIIKYVDDFFEKQKGKR